MKYYIGIDLGGTNIKGAVVSETGEILRQSSCPTRAEAGAVAVTESIANMINDLAAGREISGVGMGCPGTVDDAGGTVVYACNLGWMHYDVRAALREKTGFSVRLVNDANAAALAEVKAGCAKGAQSAVVVTLGTGVGGGVVLDGKVYEGDLGPGTELGHTTLIFGGEPCTCGQRGCLEAYASATALLRQRHAAELAHPETAMKRFDPADGSAPFVCAAEGDETAKAVVEQYITYVGAGLVNFINIFAPEVVLIGGGVSNAGEALIGPLNEYVRQNRYGGRRSPTCEVRRAALGGDAGIIGAAYLDREP